MAEHGPPQMLEQRIIDLLYTFCETSAKNQNTPITLTPEDAPESLSQKEKQELNILAQNLAFLIRDRDSNYGRKIGADDVFVTMLNWGAYKNSLDDATLAVMVRTMKTTKILQIRITPTEDILQKLGREVDKMLLKALLRA